MDKLKSFVANSLLFVGSTSIILFVAEKIYSSMLFSNISAMKEYRKAPLYAAEWDEDYHKLLLIWNITQNKKNPNPQFGWLNYKIWNRSLLQQTVLSMEDKRPVLMYGDSYAQTLDTSVSVNDLLYHDTIFSTRFQFINYGVGAYGVDQMYSLFKSTVCKFEKPIVVFSLLTLDLDRSALEFRDGPKPYYYINTNDELVFDNSKLTRSSKFYVKKNPPKIKSYLWRKFLYSDINFFPDRVTEYLTGETSQREKIKKLNSKLLQAVIRQLRESHIDFMFLAFESPSDCKVKRSENWRYLFIDNLLKQNKVNYFWANDVLSQPPNPADSLQFYSYYIYGDGHPTPFYYQQVVKEIKKRVLSRNYDLLSDSILISQKDFLCHPTFKELLDSVSNKVISSKEMLETAKRETVKNNCSLTKSVNDFRNYLLNQSEQEK